MNWNVILIYLYNRSNIVYIYQILYYKILFYIILHLPNFIL